MLEDNTQISYSQHVDFSVFEQGNRTLLFQIHQNCAAGLPLGSRLSMQHN
jgi:hypothetical protein